MTQTLPEENRECLDAVAVEMGRRFKAQWRMNLVISPSHVIQHYSAVINGEEHWYHMIVNTISGKVQMFKRQEEWDIGDNINVSFKRRAIARGLKKELPA